MPTRGPKPKPAKLNKLGGRSHKEKENIIDLPAPEAMQTLSYEIRMELEEV